MSIQYRKLQQMTKILCNNCSSKWLHWQLKLKSWPNNSEQRATVKVAHDRQGVRHRNKRHSCVITTRDSATKHVSARHPVVHKQKQFREMNKTAVNRSHQWSWMYLLGSILPTEQQLFSLIQARISLLPSLKIKKTILPTFCTLSTAYRSRCMDKKYSR